MKKCYNCGNILGDADMFCEKCGANVGNANGNSNINFQGNNINGNSNIDYNNVKGAHDYETDKNFKRYIHMQCSVRSCYGSYACYCGFCKYERKFI